MSLALNQLRVRLAVLAVVVLVIFGVAVALALEVSRAIREDRALAGRANAAADAAGAVLDVLQDTETGQRGFLLTLRPEFLEPYLAARAKSAAALDHLVSVTNDSPALREDVAALRDLALDKLALAAHSLDVVRAEGRDAAIALLKGDDAKRAMDAARARVARIVATATRERDERVIALRQREVETIRGGLLITIVGLLLLAGALTDLLVRRERMMRIAAALELERGRLAGTVDNLRDGVVVFDEAGGLVVWNSRFFDITGLPAEMARNGTPWSRFVEAASGWAGAPFGHAPTVTTPASHEVLVEGRVVELWRSAMPDGGQVALAADITRRTRAEAIARQASRMEGLGQFTGGVAHDFNNLLQVVSANLELIGLRIGPDEALGRRLDAALAAVDRATRLTRHLLSFARQQPLAPEEIDPVLLLHGMDDMLRRSLGEAIELEFAFRHAVSRLHADPAQLESAILNLCINARDAMPEGGRLTIEAADERDGLDNLVALTVTDTGQGMTPEQIGRAMEPFYTTKPVGRGTGLGLPMVLGFAEQSGGRFELSSEPGRGTTARLLLPRSAAGSAASATAADVRPQTTAVCAAPS